MKCSTNDLIKSVNTFKQNKNGTRKVSISFKKTTSKTRPEFTRECDINLLVRKGIIENTHPLNYMDVSQTPSFEDAFEVVQYAQQTFNALPAAVRKLIDNDPAQLQNFIKNPENADLLVKYNLVKPKQKLDELTQNNKTTKNTKTVETKKNENAEITK